MEQPLPDSFAPEWAEAYGDSGHLSASQVFSLHPVDGKVVQIYLARPRSGIFKDRDNNFYFKHVIHPSRKGLDTQTKLQKRHIIRGLTPKHRKDAKMGGAQAPLWGGRAGQGFTKKFKPGQLTWLQKYGSEKGGEDSTAIDISQVSKDEFRRVLLDAVRAATYGGTKKLIGTAFLQFKANCVISLHSPPCNYMYVDVEKVDNADGEFYDVYHFAYTKQERHRDGA